MEIETMFGNEFFDYRIGFLTGKNDILNYIFDCPPYLEELLVDDDWYSLGYQDAFNLYKQLYERRGALSFDEIMGQTSQDMLIASYFWRISQYNEANKEMFCAIKYKVKYKENFDNGKEDVINETV